MRNGLQTRSCQKAGDTNLLARSCDKNIFCADGGT